MYSNCLVWSIVRLIELQIGWLRAGRPVGYEPYWYLRSSRLAPWWVPSWGVEYWNGTRWVKEKFVPDDKTVLRWYQVWRKFWFRGHVEVTHETNE